MDSKQARMDRITAMVKESFAYQVATEMVDEVKSQIEGATDMTDTTHGLPESVMEQAAKYVKRAIEEYGMRTVNDVVDYDEREEASLAVRAALPILTTAIETALLERMIADAEEVDAETSIYPIYPDGHESSEPLILADWLRTYLTTAESEATDAH